MIDEEARRARLEEDAKRRLEHAEERHRQSQAHTAAAAEVERQASLEQARLQIDHAPVAMAVALTQQGGASLYQQNEAYSAVLGEALLTLYRGMQDHNLATVRAAETLLKSRIDERAVQQAHRHELDKLFFEGQQQIQAQKHALEMQNLAAGLAISLEKIKGDTSLKNTQISRDSEYQTALLNGALSLVQTFLGQNHETQMAKQGQQQQSEKMVLESLIKKAQDSAAYRHALEMAFANALAHEKTYFHDKVLDFVIWAETRKIDPLKGSAEQVKQWFSEFEAEAFPQNP